MRHNTTVGKHSAPAVGRDHATPTATSDTTYGDALVDARDHSPDALLAMREVFAHDAVDPDPEFPGDVGRVLARERVRAITVELARRERLARLSNGTATASDRQHAAWVELARAVRERVEVPEIFALVGHPLQPVGHNRRRGAREYAGACPLCGGADRLRVWAGPNGRAWCRVCSWSADAITAAMSLIPGCGDFRDALRWLAALAGAGEVPR